MVALKPIIQALPGFFENSDKGKKKTFFLVE